jgi:hypothetical protein
MNTDRAFNGVMILLPLAMNTDRAFNGDEYDKVNGYLALRTDLCKPW